MSRLLTLEDCNTEIYDNQNFWWYEIDSTKITTGDEDFTDVKYDFCTVSRQNRNNGYYKYTVKVHNSLWTTGYFMINDPSNNMDIIETTEEDNILTIPKGRLKIRILLYMGPLNVETEVMTFGKALQYYIINDTLSLNLKELSTPQTIRSIQWWDGGIFEYVESLTKGYNLITYAPGGHVVPIDAGFVFVNLLKTDFQFNCTQNLVVGRVNKVQLGTLTDYLPNGDYVGEYVPTIRVEYDGNEIPVSFDEDLNDYVFNIDLTDKNKPSKIRFKVNVEPNEALNETSTTVVLDADYESISSYSDLVNACNIGGASHIRLGADITLTSSISIAHNIKIIGDEHTIDLNGKGFVINDGVTFKAENVVFDSGNIAIKQSKNSTLELTGCTFNNCTGFGSCICCDIDYDSLSVEDDYQTTLTDCLFTNNNLCIVHSGELTVNGCKYHNTDTDYIDKENVAFLYQFDGEANITNSIFDIDYDTDTLCSNEESIGFAQALLQCGITAKINNATKTDLMQDNNLPFDRNASHIFAKYYYPQIETCVYTSPVLGREDQAVCYTVTGENWIYKQNVQITRASWDSQNETRKIIWEE